MKEKERKKERAKVSNDLKEGKNQKDKKVQMTEKRKTKKEQKKWEQR